MRGGCGGGLDVVCGGGAAGEALEDRVAVRVCGGGGSQD